MDINEILIFLDTLMIKDTAFNNLSFDSSLELGLHNFLHHSERSVSSSVLEVLCFVIFVWSQIFLINDKDSMVDRSMQKP